jgi:hypothetical protein
MGIGTGIVLIVLGLILLLGAVDLPASVDEVIAENTLGWILVIAGGLGLLLALIMNQQRQRRTHITEHREH